MKFTTGRDNGRSTNEEAQEAHTDYLREDWLRAELIAFPETSTDLFIDVFIRKAPDDAILFGERDTIGALAERASLSSRSQLSSQGRFMASLTQSLSAVRPPIETGPVFIQAATFLEEIQMRARSLGQVAFTLAGYRLDPMILGDAVAAHLTADVIFEIDKRSAPIVVQSGKRLLPVDLRVATGLLSSVEASNEMRDAWVVTAFDGHEPEGDAPTEATVVEHAQFLADTGMDLLERMHAPLAHPAYRDVFDIWRRNIAVLTQRAEPLPTAMTAIERLNALDVARQLPPTLTPSDRPAAHLLN